MKIAFFSNFLNHHQLPLCKAFLSRENVEFVFVATEPIPKDRLTMGYEDMNSYPFVVRSYESNDAKDQAMLIAKTYDMVIFGACSKDYIEYRMNENLLSFRFCERPLKKGAWRRFIPRTRKKIHDGYIQFKNKNMYILGASAYTSHDLVLCGFDKDKCFKWGYFPKVIEIDVEEILNKKSANKKVEILYAGRLLKLKRVIDSLKAINLLVKQGVENINFTIIGDGEEKNCLTQYVEKHNLKNYVTFLPFMSPEEVREYMCKADIFIFSSNFYEGWGAVVNEAMNSVCSLLVSHSVGSSPYLIKQGETGYVYELANVNDLASKLKLLVEDAKLRHNLGKNAYQNLINLWNAETAVDRLLTMFEGFKYNAGISYADGPLSKAKVLKKNWVHKK